MISAAIFISVTKRELNFLKKLQNEEKLHEEIMTPSECRISDNLILKGIVREVVTDWGYNETMVVLTEIGEQLIKSYAE